MGMSTINISEGEIKTLRGEITETSDFDLIPYMGRLDFNLITVNRSSNPTIWEKSDNGKYIANYNGMFTVFEHIKPCKCYYCELNKKA